MNVFKKTLLMLTLGVGSLFIGASAADAQWGYRSYGGGYAPRVYSGGGYYGNPYGGYRNYGYNNRAYGGRNFYNNRGYNNRGYYGGGSGVYLGRGGIGIRF